MTRKMMYAALLPHMKGTPSETDIMEFEWESQLIQRISDEEVAEKQAQIAATKAFWKQQDELKKTAQT